MRPALKAKPCPVARTRVGKSSGRYSGNQPKNITVMPTTRNVGAGNARERRAAESVFDARRQNPPGPDTLKIQFPISPRPKIGFLAVTEINTVRGAGISPQIVHAGERFFPRGKRSIVLTRVFL